MSLGFFFYIMSTNHTDRLERALKDLTVDELEGVLDALVLVSERWEQPKSQPQGIYLVPPYGELIASGEMKCFAKPRHDERLIGDRILVSGKKAYGVMHVGEPVETDVSEFDNLFGQSHRISRKDRLQWWPERETLHVYPVEFDGYDEPKDVVVPPGVQTYMRTVNVDTSEKNVIGQCQCLNVTVVQDATHAMKGFSGRQSIEPNEGLLIPLQPTTGIWMKDTLVPLTVAFLDKSYRVLSITDLEPMDETVHLGPTDSTWALEACRAWFDRENVEIGDVIKLRSGDV